MGLLTTVKETVLRGEDAGRVAENGDAATETDGRSNDEQSNAGRSPVAAVGSASPDQLVAAWDSEADCVVATGRSRADVLVELVEANGGRVKQSELVELTGWSKATVSRYLSGLEDEGTLDRVPLGRQKVVLLPDESLLDEQLGPDFADRPGHADESDRADDGLASDATYPRT